MTAIALAGITVAIAAEHHLSPAGITAGDPLSVVLWTMDSTIVAGACVQSVERADVGYAIGALTVRPISTVSSCTGGIATTCSIAEQSIVRTERTIVRTQRAIVRAEQSILRAEQAARISRA